MEVVLLQRVAKLGQMGDVVRVKDGYGRNYLLPQGKALRATKENLARFQAERATLEARNLESKREAEAAAARIEGMTFVIIRSASESGALYGSVTARDAAEAAEAAGVAIERHQVHVTKPIKELGIHPMTVVLHPEISATIKINVARSADEAELQASGRSIQDLRAAAEAEAEFEIAELFDDLGGAARDDDGPIEDRDSRADDQPRI